MKIIYFYKDLKKVYSVYAKSLRDVIETPKAYFGGFDENTIISEEEFKYPVLDGETLREKTKEELVKEGVEVPLEAGEKVEDKKLIRVQKPTQYHTWTGTEWRANLEEVKNQINERWKVERQFKVDADLDYKGSIFQMREDIDVKNFEQRGLQIALGQKKLTDKEEWRLKDNTFKEFTYGELLEVVGLWGERKKKIWEDLKRMWLELEKASSVEEIEKISWSEGI